MSSEETNELLQRMEKMMELQIKTLQLVAYSISAIEAVGSVVLAIQVNLGSDQAEITEAFRDHSARLAKARNELAFKLVQEICPPPADDKWWDMPSGVV